jgi:hypothetical protein
MTWIKLSLLCTTQVSHFSPYLIITKNLQSFTRHHHRAMFNIPDSSNVEFKVNVPNELMGNSNTLHQRCTHFPYKSMLEPTQNPRRQKADVSQVPLWGSTNSGCHRKKFIRDGELTPSIYALLHYTISNHRETVLIQEYISSGWCGNPFGIHEGYLRYFILHCQVQAARPKGILTTLF